MLEHHQLEITESKSTINYISFVGDDYWYHIFRRNVRKTNSFPTSKYFQQQSKSKLQKHISSTLCNSKNGDFEILNYFTASTKEICTSCAVLKKLFLKIRNF
jgi:hypothetical protein